MRRRRKTRDEVDASTIALLENKAYGEPSVFEPGNLLREARRQKGLSEAPVPAICVLDPDGDLVRHVRRHAAARRSAAWACYHTELWEFAVDEHPVGVVGCAVGAAFAVLVAEELFASGCRLLLSVTSAGRVTEVALRSAKPRRPSRRRGRSASSRSRWRRLVCTRLPSRGAARSSASPTSRTRWASPRATSRRATLMVLSTRSPSSPPSCGRSRRRRLERSPVMIFRQFLAPKTGCASYLFG